MFDFAFVTSEVSLLSVSLKSVANCSVLLTKAWLVDGEVCNSAYITMKVPNSKYTLSNCFQLS